MQANHILCSAGKFGEAASNRSCCQDELPSRFPGVKCPVMEQREARGKVLPEELDKDAKDLNGGHVRIAERPEGSVAVRVKLHSSRDLLVTCRCHRLDVGKVFGIQDLGRGVAHVGEPDEIVLFCGIPFGWPLVDAMRWQPLSVHLALVERWKHLVVLADPFGHVRRGDGGVRGCVGDRVDRHGHHGWVYCPDVRRHPVPDAELRLEVHHEGIRIVDRYCCSWRMSVGWRRWQAWGWV